MLPGISGIDAIKKIRETDQEMPILILSAKDREIDKVNGLDSGSDDYMTTNLIKHNNTSLYFYYIGSNPSFK